MEKQLINNSNQTWAERFWNKVGIAGPGACWHWNATRDPCNYGRFRLEGRNEGAHRLAWVLANGPIPEGKHILHSCDHPWCVNPSHLWLGNHKENMADMASKGRRNPASGERHPDAKLSESQVVEIRHSRDSWRILARRFGVGKSAIGEIINRTTWESIPDDGESEAIRRERASVPRPRMAQRKLTEEAVRFIKQSPLGVTALSKLYGVATSTIGGVRSGKNWSYVK